MRIQIIKVVLIVAPELVAVGIVPAVFPQATYFIQKLESVFFDKAHGSTRNRLKNTLAATGARRWGQIGLRASNPIEQAAIDLPRLEKPDSAPIRGKSGQQSLLRIGGVPISAAKRLGDLDRHPTYFKDFVRWNRSRLPLLDRCYEGGTACGLAFVLFHLTQT